MINFYLFVAAQFLFFYFGLNFKFFIDRMKYAICYLSTATENLNPSAIKNIMDKTQQNNGTKNITGILLYSGGNFLQVLEGEKTTILNLYSKIEKDPRHKSIIKIIEKEINSGAYNGYMACIFAKNEGFNPPEVVTEYLEPIRGMEYSVQQTVRSILEAFLKTKI